MSFKKLFAPYMRKLRLEAAVKALLAGLLAGLSIGIVITVVSRITRWECDLLTAMTYSICAALIIAVPVYFIYRPNMKKTARRIDKEGFEERAETMLALEKDGSYIASLQREDARERLSKIKTSHIPMRIGYRPFAAVGALIVALSLISMLPYRSLEATAEPLPPEVVEESRIIADLIAQLRETVEQAEVSEDIRAELDQIVDELEASVTDLDSTLEKAAKISEARTKILAIIERETGNKDIGDILEEDEDTKELGEAINSQDNDKLHEAVENLRDEMLSLPEDERQQWFKDMADKLNSAVEAAGDETGDQIIEALKQLAQSFEDAAAQYDDETIENPDDSAVTEGGLGLSGAEQAIADETDRRNELSDELQEIVGIIEDARDELFGTTGGEDEGSGEASGGNEEAPGTEDGETSDGNAADGEGGGTGSGGDAGEEEDDETFFDPSQVGDIFGQDDFELTDEDFIRDVYEQIIVEGEVSYKDSYYEYYADALESISRSEIPDSLKDVIIAYFTSLE